MLTPSQLVRFIASRRLPQPTPDQGPANEIYGRAGRYGELYVNSMWPTDQVLADEGSYYTATLGPGATAIILGLSAAYSATQAAVVVQNSDAAAFDGGKRIYLRYIRMSVSTVPTSATAFIYASVIDPANRVPTTVVPLVGGTAATATAGKTTPVSTSLDQGTPSIANVYFPLSTNAGAPPTVPAASASARTIVGNGFLRGQIPVLFDEYILQFGNADYPSSNIVATAARITSIHPPIVINPGATFLLSLWGPSNATNSIAFNGMDMGWVER